MVDDGDRGLGLRSDGPAPALEVDLVVGIATPLDVKGRVQVEQTRFRARGDYCALFLQRLVPGVVWREARGPADGPVLTLHLLLQHCLGGRVSMDFLVGQERQHPPLEGSEAALDLALGLGAWGGQMVHVKCREGPLELRSGISAVAGGTVPEQGESVGVDGLWTAVVEERTAEVLEMGRGGVHGNEVGGDVPAGVVVDGEQEGLLGVGLPPGVDGGVMLPELPDAGPLSAAAGLGDGIGRLDQGWEVGVDVGGQGLAIPPEGEAGGEFIGQDSEFGWPL